MTSADEIVAAAVERRRGDPTSLLQILREAQEALDWIAPETVEAVAAQLRIPIVRVQSVLQFYSFLYDKPRGRYRLLFSDNITDRMLGSLDLLRAHAEAPEAEARRSLARRARQRRSDLVHRHVRPGAGAAGQQSRRHPAHRAARRRDQRPRPRARPFARMARRLFPRRRQHPARRHAARRLLRARQGATRGDRARPPGHARRDEALELARARRRRVPHRR